MQNNCKNLLDRFIGILVSFLKRIRKGGNIMAVKKLPKVYTSIRKRYKEFAEAVDHLGKTARDLGPVDEKTSHLIQLAAAATIRSEGSVHSHARRAIEAGAKPEEVYHSLILLTSTIGFPAVSAAISWVDDVVQKK
jgi:4-carboxymuconolactone decarboxylase